MPVFDSHMHTTLCHHAYGEPEEYAEQGIDRGLDGIIFTCHSPMPDGWFKGVRMEPEDFETYVALVHECRDQYEGRLDVRLGMESDWFPGMETWLEELHSSAEFHFVLGSVHYFGSEYLEMFGHLSYPEFVANYFDQVAVSAESGLFDSLAHPDLVKNYEAENWNFDDHSEVIGEALDRIAATGVAMELNTSGVRKKYSERNPSVPMLGMMKERGIPVTIGSDSHVPDRVGDPFLEAVSDLETAGYEEVSVFKNREPESVPLSEFREALEEAEELG